LSPAAHAHPWAVIVGGFLACAVLAACSSGPGHPAPKSPSRNYTTGSAAGYALYQSASENRTFVNNAVEELIRRCMVRAGFQYWPMPELPAQYRDPARALSIDDAKLRGYRALDPPTQAPGSAERDAYLNSLTADQQAQYDRALVGDRAAKKTVDTPAGKLTFSIGGCTTAAFAQLVPDPTRYISLDYQVANLTSLPEFQPALDPALKTATASWASCMSAAGYHYSAPGPAIEAASKLDSSSSGGQNAPLSAKPAPAALGIAVADATCRGKTAFDTANRVAVHNSLAVVADAHQADILTFNDLATKAAQKAREILSR